MKPAHTIKAALICLSLCTAIVASTAQAQGASNFTPDWVKRSNEIAYKVLESNAKFVPEFSGQMGEDEREGPGKDGDPVVGVAAGERQTRFHLNVVGKIFSIPFQFSALAVPGGMFHRRYPGAQKIGSHTHDDSGSLEVISVPPLTSEPPR